MLESLSRLLKESLDIGRTVGAPPRILDYSVRGLGHMILGVTCDVIAAPPACHAADSAPDGPRSSICDDPIYPWLNRMAWWRMAS